VDLDRMLAGLDPQQREAVTTDAAPLAVIAAAGSGKTRVLTARIAHRIASGSAHPSHVLALTFTRDAAGELHRRLRRLDLRERIEAGTFHSVALRLLRDRALATHQAPPVVAQDRHRLVREALTELKLRVDVPTAVAEIDWARARRIEPHTYASQVRAERRRTAFPADRFVELAERYRAVKRARGVIDFDDLLERCLAAIETDPTFAEVVRWRFRHLFVDEAQDLNPLQHALLEAWRGGRADLCLVGDPRQAIYGWNGADHRLLAEVEQRFPGITVVHLSGNYRCAEPVVEVGRAVLATVDMPDDSESRVGTGPAVRVRAFESEQAEAAGVADEVRRLAGQVGGRMASVAVLARTNDQLTAIAAALEQRQVPLRRAGGRRPIDTVVAEASRCTNREQLAVWADEHAVSSDEVRRRVAEEVDRFLASGESGTLRAWLERRDALVDLDTDDDDRVDLLSFHAAKGREWDAVVVAGVETGLVPHSSAVSAAQRAEEARLLYVAVTRASHHLVLTHAASRHGRTSTPSPMLPAIEEVLTDGTTAPPPAELRTRSGDPYAAVREWRHAVARIAGVDDRAVCSDRVMRSLHDDPPATLDELARRLAISPQAASRLRPLPVPDRAPTGRTPRASSR
jgi:DNA helicase-2/ATP-dependent DNA helicase PcrA